MKTFITIKRGRPNIRNLNENTLQFNDYVKELTKKLKEKTEISKFHCRVTIKIVNTDKKNYPLTLICMI